MIEIINDIIESGNESYNVDFKRTQYPLVKGQKKPELLKDLIAMANHPSNDDKYIIIGAKPTKNNVLHFFDIEHTYDDASYQQYVGSYVEPILNFEYKYHNYKRHRLAYFRIFNNCDRPYLIKKNVLENTSSSRIKFEMGAGFIRKGTSTKNISRTDFDSIYRRKFIKRDRKSDIIIQPYFKSSNANILKQLDLKYFDFSIENTSAESIAFDVEVKVFKTEDLTVFSEHELTTQIKKTSEPKSFYHAASLSFDMDPHAFNYSKQERKNYFLVSCNKLRNQSTAFEIPQNDIIEDVLGGYLYPISTKKILFEAEIIVRSDSFTDGPIILPVELEFITKM